MEKNTTQTYTISRYEQKGDSLFICLNSINNPVYLEHFFSDSEKLDIEGTIAGLVAQLELLDEAYVAPLSTVSKLDEVKNFKINSTMVANKKQTIVAEKLARLKVL